MCYNPPGGHGDHLFWSKQHPLIVLPDERLWPDLQAADVAVLVEDVEVKVGRDAEQGLLSHG